MDQSESPAARPRRFQAVLERVFGIDLRALACFRILLALYALYDLGWRAVDLVAFYTDYGAFPVEAAIQMRGESGPWIYLSPYMYLSGATGVIILFLLHTLALLALLVGWRTRLATFVVWFLTVSLHARNPLVLHSGDVYLRLLLLWSLFVPLGARFSVDGLAARLVAHRQPLPRRVLSLGTAGLLTQVAFMYWFTLLLKTAPEWRSDFTAVYYALSIEQYALPLGQFLRELRWTHKPLTFFTVFLELFGPILAFSPIATERLRLLVVPAFVLFHLVALGWTMNIGLFVYIAAIPWLLFLPTSFWDGVTAWWNKLPATGLKAYLLPLRERAIDWRSRRIASALYRGEAPPRPGLPLPLQALAGYFILHSLLVNLHSPGPQPFNRGLPVPPRSLTMLVRLDQYWAMFAPRPTVEDGWYVIPARTVSGHWIDLNRNGSPVLWNKPDALAISRLYSNDRWAKFMMNLWGRAYQSFRIYYCRYLDRKWHAVHSGPEALEEIRVFFMLKETLPNYQSPNIVPILLHAYQVGQSPRSGRATLTVTPSVQAPRSTPATPVQAERRN